MKIRDKEVDGYVVAELGTAFATIDEHERVRIVEYKIAQAARCGVNAVKVQMFVPDEPLFCPLKGDEPRWERWRLSLLSENEWIRVRTWTHDLGLAFIASVFQPGGIELGKRVGLDAWKVATRANQTFPYDEISGPLIVSCRPTDDIERDEHLVLLQCMSHYPTHLNRARYNSLWADGLSDHSGAPWPAIDALARGAKMVEVHFGDTDGPDAKVCVSFDELKMICEARDALKEMKNAS